MYLIAFHSRFRPAGMATPEVLRQRYEQWDGIAEMPVVEFDGERLEHEFCDDDGAVRVELARGVDDPLAWRAGIAVPAGVSPDDSWISAPALFGEQLPLPEDRLVECQCLGYCDAMESWYFMVTERADGARVAVKRKHWIRAGEGLWKPRFD